MDAVHYQQIAEGPAGRQYTRQHGGAAEGNRVATGCASPAAWKLGASAVAVLVCGSMLLAPGSARVAVRASAGAGDGTGLAFLAQVPGDAVPAKGGHAAAAQEQGAVQGGAGLPLDPPDFDFLPTAKRTIRLMDKKISDKIAWDDWDAWSVVMEPFWAEDMVYDTNFCPAKWCPSVATVNSDKGGPLQTVTSLNNGTGLRSWFDREHLPFSSAFGNYSLTQMIFVADEQHASTTSYMQSRWRTDFAGLTPPQNWNQTTIITRVFDFYRMDGEKILYNWMVLDLVYYMHQNLAASGAGRVVPAPPLKEYFRPPNTLMGGPVPTSKFANRKHTGVSARVVLTALGRDFGLSVEASRPLAARYSQGGGAANASVQGPAEGIWAPDLVFYGSEGIGAAESEGEFREHVLGRLLRTPYGDAWQLNVDVLVCEADFCAAHGHFVGAQTGTFLGVPATGRTMTLHFGMHFRVEGEQVVEAWGLFELPRAMADIGEDLWQNFYTAKGGSVQLQAAAPKVAA